ncbi:MAG TPA: KTSC domain-containing protein [Gemmata sp.]
MARKPKMSDAFAAAYPAIARWVREEAGWIELGSDEFSSSFIRAIHPGGTAWEGENDYPTIDAAFAAADAGVAEWLAENIDTIPKSPPKKKPARAKKPTELKLIPVESSMLTAIGYDEAMRELTAVFVNGNVWRYSGVPKSVYQQLLASDSKGSFMRSLVIGAYPESRVRR